MKTYTLPNKPISYKILINGSWSSMAVADRAKIILKEGEGIRKHAEELALI